MSKSSEPTSNSLLSALKPEEFDNLMPELELVSLNEGTSLSTNKKPAEFLHFPLDCVAGMYQGQGKDVVQVATTGNEGAVGISLNLLGAPVFNKTEVISSGYAYRLSTDTLNRKFQLHTPLQQLLLRYSQILITQMKHSSGCRRSHSIEQQLCRWLLQSLDRLPSMELHTTQQMIANKLGLTLQSVQETTDRLRSMGLIDLGSDYIGIHDRRSIEDRACGCYTRIKNEIQHWALI
jgi:DNA-binding MarR family transcriptional regulator